MASQHEQYCFNEKQVLLDNRKIEGLRLVLLKALNKNQILILFNINSVDNITYLLSRMSKGSGIPLSTLKLNAKILRKLDIITFSNGSPVTVTPTGSLILQIINSSKIVSDNNAKKK